MSKKKNAQAGPVDHVAEAKRIMGLTVRGHATSGEWATMVHLGNQIAAGTHATLAVAEQLRIANLLAFARFEHAATDPERIYTSMEKTLALLGQAADALGIVDDQAAAA